MALKKNLMKL